jgi:hypothetical protein
LKGFYILNDDQIPFVAMNGGPELVIIVFVNGPWKEVAEATGGNGHTINVTRESFNDFISNHR